MFVGCNLESIELPSTLNSIGSSNGKCTDVYCPSLEQWLNISFNSSYLGNDTNLYCNNELIEGNLIIPEGITSIKDYAFSGYTKISSVSCSSTVESIGKSAFSGCTNLSGITLPNALTSIGEYAFYQCSNLTDISIPGGVTSIGSYAFSQCTNLSEINLSSGLKSIGSNAFYSCKKLSEIVLPSGFETIGSRAFFYCTGMTRISIPSSLTSIGSSAFDQCTSLNRVDLENIGAWCNVSFESMVSNPLYYAKSIYVDNEHITELHIPQGIQSVSKYAFYNSDIEKLYLPGSLETIPSYVFTNCKDLLEVYTDIGLKTIGEKAFYECTNLQKVELSDSLESIETSAFENCTSLATINIPSNVTTIAQRAFYNCKSLSSAITIPNGVTSIPKHLFYNCESLPEVNIPNTVTSIGDVAFYNCKALTRFEIPNSVTTINSMAFNGCSGLTEVVIPYGVTTISNSAFQGCKSLKNVVIPDSVVSISSYVFNGCTGLTSIKLSKNITMIDPDTFYGCTSLKEITIPENVTLINNSAFDNCTALETVYIPVSVTSISTSAFNKCNALKDVYYSGTENQYNLITNVSNITPLVNATKHYNYIPPCEVHTPHEAVRENEIAPTCTEAGSYDEVVYCSVCGMELSREQKAIEALGHNYSAVVTAPTCTAQGYTTYTCTRCRESYISDYTDTLEHTPAQAVIENEIPSTCAKKGSYDEVVYCSVCGAELSRTRKSIDKLAHTPAEAVEENRVEPTCISVGSYDEVVYCSVCGEEISRQTKEIEMLPHTVVVDAAVAPTCTQTGLTEGSHCSVCNTVIVAQQTVNALGHNYSAVVTKPTCTARGYTTYTCTRCNDSYISDYTDMTAHTPAEAVVENRVEPTDSLEGSFDEVVYCSVCGTELSRQMIIIPALGHNYEAVVTAPTCTAQGYTTYTCADCGYTYIDDYVDAIGHTPANAVAENRVEPTCKKKGSYDEVIYCAECGEELARTQKAIDKLAHTPGGAVQENIVEPTCTAAGAFEEVVYCSVCGEELSREIIAVEMLAHTVVVDAAVPATCTQEGLTEGSHCSVCSTVLVAQKRIAPTGHRYKTVVTPPTCTEDGFTTYTCTICGDTYISDNVDAIGHTPATAVRENEVPSTCSAEGSYEEVVYCSVCGMELSREQKAIDALGHDYSAVVTVPTCTAKGYTTYTCTRCNDSYISDYTEMASHTPAEAVRENEIPSTCSKKGSYDEVVYCAECGAELSRSSVELELAEHKLRVYETVLPTCTAQGYTTYKCTVCAYTFNDNYTDVIPHKAGSAVIENEIAATCTAEGSYDEVVYCTECHTELSRETIAVEMLAHTAVTDEAVAATCTQTGLTEGSHCSVCGKVLVAQQTTPFAEHIWDDGEVIQQATTSQEGIVKYTCTVCQAVKTETIEKLAGKGKFVASNVSSKAGREVSVEIYIEENPGITSLSIDVAYPEGLTLTGVTDEKLFGSGFSKGKLNSNPIALSWYKSDSSNDDSTGLFATLTFTIDEELPAGDYPIEISFDPDNIFDNGFNNVDFDVVNGNVNIYSVIPGDIYQDDEINMKDIVLLQQYINRWDVEIDTEIADVNKDGKINMKDLVLIQQYINGWDVVLQ